MEASIISLSNGIIPDIKPNIAAVKPTDHSTHGDILSEYKIFAPDAMKRIDAAMKNKESKLTLTHPWFGPFNARQWYWVMASHQGIHWQQLKQIRAKL